MKIKNVMTRRLITVAPNDTFGKVVKVLADKNISGCPVVKNGKLVGVVTQTDIIRTIDVYEKVNKRGEIFPLIVSMIKSRSDAASMKKLLKIKVKDFMNGDVVSIDMDGDIYDAARLMNKYNIDRLPVIKSKNLVGILTKKDIMKFLEKVGE